MRYLGGKSKLARVIGEYVNAARWPGGLVWEPFCGGLGATPAIASGGPVFLTDVCAPLISMYSALDEGWTPPQNVTREEYAAAVDLPDDDPRKAFILFGCSFGGKWRGGYARTLGRNYAAETARNLAATWRALGDHSFACVDFLEAEPDASLARELVIYADPPYRDTTGYKATTHAFDSSAFELRCLQWAAKGALVLISEFACTIGDEVWSAPRRVEIGSRASVTERLFLVAA